MDIGRNSAPRADSFINSQCSFPVFRHRLNCPPLGVGMIWAEHTGTSWHFMRNLLLCQPRLASPTSHIHFEKRKFKTPDFGLPSFNASNSSRLIVGKPQHLSNRGILRYPLPWS